MLKPVQVTSRDRRWVVLDVEAGTGDVTRSQVSSWRWSQYRWLHVYSWVNSLVVKTMTSSRLPRPTHTSQDRSVSSSTFWMTSLELSLPTTTLTLSRPAAAAGAWEPISWSSLRCPAAVRRMNYEYDVHTQRNKIKFLKETRANTMCYLNYRPLVNIRRFPPNTNSYMQFSFQMKWVKWSEVNWSEVKWSEVK